MSNKLYEKIISAIACLIIIIFCILFLFTEPAKYSKNAVFAENENRYLNTLPKISYAGLKNGEVTKELEAWFSDHFFAREFFMNYRANYEKLIQKKEINGVYLAKNGFLIEKPVKMDRIDKITEVFNNFTGKIKNANVNLILAPTAITIYDDKLPDNADKGEQLKNIEYIYSKSAANNIDVASSLIGARHEFDGTNKEDKLYYKLDHHWTTKGAYIAYKKYCDAMNLNPLSDREIKKEKVSTDFKGTIYSKVCDFSLPGECMWAYSPKYDFEVRYEDIDMTTDSFFADEYLTKKDKYSYFLNNLHPYVEITNKQINSNKELAVIKDSYANCLIPMLAGHYRRIHVFDPRSYKSSISDFVNENKNISDVLILYNMGTINNDTGIGGIF